MESEKGVHVLSVFKPSFVVLQLAFKAPIYTRTGFVINCRQNELRARYQPHRRGSPQSAVRLGPRRKFYDVY